MRRIADMLNKIKVIIPIAGVGKRLRPHTFSMPKPLIPVAGKPMVAHVLDSLTGINPDEVIFITGHMGSKLIEYIKENYDFNSTFVHQEDLLGLGFAVHLGLQKIDSGPVLVILGDTIVRTDLVDFVSSGTNCIGVKEVDDPKRFGIAVIENGRIVAMEEKPAYPKSNLAIIGLYYFTDSVQLKGYLDKIIRLDKRTRGEIQLTDAMELMINDSHVFKPYIVDGWYDCGKQETLLDTNRRLLLELDMQGNHADAEIIPPVYISPSAQIENSVIGPNVSISDNVTITGSSIKNSIIFEHAIIETCQLEDSLIGTNAVIRGIKGRLNIGHSAEVG